MKWLITFCYCAAIPGCNSNEALINKKKQALVDASNRRVEKVIADLKADCDSNLLRETYKRVQLLQKQK